MSPGECLAVGEGLPGHGGCVEGSACRADVLSPLDGLAEAEVGGMSDVLVSMFVFVVGEGMGETLCEFPSAPDTDVEMCVLSGERCLW